MMHEVVNTHRKTCAINTHRKKRAPFDKRYQLIKRRYSVQACFPRRIPHSFLLDRAIGAALRCSVSSLALLALLVVEAETPEPAAGATTETTLRTGGTTETTEAAAGAAAIIEGAAPHVRVRSAVRVRPSLISRCLVLPSFHRKQLLRMFESDPLFES